MAMSYTTPADYAAQAYGFAREPGPYADAKNKAQAWIDAMAADAGMCDPLLAAASAKGYTDTTRSVGEPVKVDVDVDDITDYNLSALCGRAAMNNSASQVVRAADTGVTWQIDASYAGPGTPTNGTPDDFLARLFALEPADLEDMEAAAARASAAWQTLQTGGQVSVDAFSDVSYDVSDTITSTSSGGAPTNVTAAVVPPYVSDGKPATTYGDFVMQSEEWRKKLRVDTLSQAYSRIRELKWAKKQYARFMSDAAAWAVREQKVIDENTERTTPLYTAPTGKRVPGGDFGARRIGSADGFITTRMETALTSGNTLYGKIDALDTQDRWSYYVTPATGNGSSAADFMNKMTNAGNSGLVTAEFVRNASSTGIAYLKKGSCEVGITRDGKQKVAKEDCDQWHYLEGKEVMPANYWAKASGAII
jgi:hypothetical protein